MTNLLWTLKISFSVPFSAISREKKNSNGSQTWKSEEIDRNSLWFFWRRLLCKWRLVSIKSYLVFPNVWAFVSVFTKDCDNVYLNQTNSTRLYHLFSTMYQRFATFRFIKLCFSHSLSMPPSHDLRPVGVSRTRGSCSCWWHFQKPKCPSAHTGLLTSAGVVPPLLTTSFSVIFSATTLCIPLNSPSTTKCTSSFQVWSCWELQCRAKNMYYWWDYFAKSSYSAVLIKSAIYK